MRAVCGLQVRRCPGLVYNINRKILDNYCTIFFQFDIYEGRLTRVYKVQAALVICGIFICDFVYMRSRNGLFSGTYPLLYSDRWSFYMRIHYIRAYFWSPYLSNITRSTCTWKLCLTIVRFCFCIQILFDVRKPKQTQFVWKVYQVHWLLPNDLQVCYCLFFSSINVIIEIRCSSSQQKRSAVFIDELDNWIKTDLIWFPRI